jgi:hypothetical protein
MTDTCSEGAYFLPVRSHGLCSKHYVADLKRRRAGKAPNKRSKGDLVRHWTIQHRLDARLREVLAERLAAA